MDRLVELLAAFFRIGLFSIGGGYAVIPMIQSQLVEGLGWVDQKTFTDIITISQMTPGPLAVNASTFVGIQVAGVWGAVVATLGCVASGVAISLLLYWFFGRHRRSRYILETLEGLKASSLGLIISAAASLLSLAFWPDGAQGMDFVAAAIFLGAFYLVRGRRMNPILAMTLAGAVGLILY